MIRDAFTRIGASTSRPSIGFALAISAAPLTITPRLWFRAAVRFEGQGGPPLGGLRGASSFPAPSSEFIAASSQYQPSPGVLAWIIHIALTGTEAHPTYSLFVNNRG